MGQIQKVWTIEKVEALLTQFGYKLIEKRPAENYVYGCT